MGHKFAGSRSLLGHMRSFHSGNKKALTKTKELEVHQAFSQAGIKFLSQKMIPFKGCGLNSETRHCLLDFVIEMLWGITVVECDEFQHSHYDPSCDVRRDFDIAASVALGSGHKMVIIHYNPDPFRVDGILHKTSKKERLTKLISTIKAFEEDPAPELGFARFFMFYDQTTGQVLPDISKSWDSSHAREVSRNI